MQRCNQENAQQVAGNPTPLRTSVAAPSASDFHPFQIVLSMMGITIKRSSPHFTVR